MIKTTIQVILLSLCVVFETEDSIKTYKRENQNNENSLIYS